MKSRVLLVDDSSSALFGLKKLLSQDPNLTVVGEARTRAEALALAESLRPDLVTMDVYLGGQDGVEVASTIIKSISTRVVMVTGLDKKRAEIAFRALAAGALDVLSKPSLADDPASEHRRRRFVAALAALAQVKLVTRRPTDVGRAQMVDPFLPKKRASLLALGASTGGPPVLHRILTGLPRPFAAPIVIVQHIEASYLDAFADWLGQTGHPVTIVTRPTEPSPGQVYLAPGNAHLRLNTAGLLAPTPGEARNFQIPSIDEFFDSVAEQNATKTFAALLTGMGNDGASGLLRLAEVGGTTVVQSLESCVVPGMPSAALELNDKAQQLTPEELVATAIRFFQHAQARREANFT